MDSEDKPVEGKTMLPDLCKLLEADPAVPDEPEALNFGDDEDD